MTEKRNRKDSDSEDDDYEDIASDSSDPSTSDEEDTASTSSMEEIAEATKVAPTKTLFYRYISADPIPKGTDKYEVIREGSLHIGLPTTSDVMPPKAEMYSVVHDTANNEYVSALRVKEAPTASIVRYYIFNNLSTWTAQQRRLLPQCKMGTTVLANLSLAIHGLHGDAKFDKELLSHPDLVNYRIDDKDPAHLLDTPHAKRLIDKAKRAKTVQEKKRKTAAAAANDGGTPKRAKKTKKPKSTAIVEDDSSPAKSPQKSGTTPSKPPAMQPKQGKGPDPAPAAAAGTKPRQLKLPLGKKTSSAKSPSRTSKGAAAAGKASVTAANSPILSMHRARPTAALGTNVPVMCAALPELAAFLAKIGIHVTFK